MARTLLKAQVRIEHGTRNVKRLRRRGIIPGVLYGDVKENISIGVDTKELHKILRGKGGDSAIFDLQVEGQGLEKPLKKTVIVKEVQRDNMKDAVIHVDFAAISMTEKLVAKVAVVRAGEPVGVTLGGVLEQILREIEVECLPADLPELLTVDVSALTIGDSIKVAQVKVPEGVRIVDDPNLILFTVSMPKEEKVEEAAPAEGEAAEGAPAEGAPAEGEAKAEGEEKEGAKGKEKEGAKGKGKEPAKEKGATAKGEEKKPEGKGRGKE